MAAGDSRNHPRFVPQKTNFGRPMQALAGGLVVAGEADDANDEGPCGDRIDCVLRGTGRLDWEGLDGEGGNGSTRAGTHGSSGFPGRCFSLSARGCFDAPAMKGSRRGTRSHGCRPGRRAARSWQTLRIQCGARRRVRGRRGARRGSRGWGARAEALWCRGGGPVPPQVTVA